MSTLRHKYLLEIDKGCCYECGGQVFLEFKTYPWSSVLDGVKWLIENARARISSDLSSMSYQLPEEEFTLIHGAAGAADGADTICQNVAYELGWGVEVYPYLSKYGRAGGSIRNQQMLDTGIDYAFGYQVMDSRGTADMLGKLTRANVPHTLWEMHVSRWNPDTTQYE